MSSRRLWVLVLGLCLALPAVALGQTVAFVDESGAAASVYPEGGRAYIRVVHAAADTSPSPDTVQVILTSSRAGDVEIAWIGETGPSTGVFLGEIPLVQGTATANGWLETAADPDPPYTRDSLQASYGGSASPATASLVGAILEFKNAFGQPATAFGAGETVYLRAVAPLRNTDPLSRDLAMVSLTALNDSETVYLSETGNGTGVFEGWIESDWTGSAQNNGTLEVFPPGQTMTARLDHTDAPTFSEATAQLAESRTTFVDAQGKPAETYLESTRAYVEVAYEPYFFSWQTPDTVQATVTANNSGDSETVTLVETGPETGILRGSIRLARGPAIPGNGIVETLESGPPYSFDTLHASFQGSTTASTDSVGTLGSLTSFLDAYGNEVTSYAAGDTVFVRVEDHNFNQPNVIDSVTATVQSLSTQDAETLTLLEVDNDTGIFEGSLQAQAGAPANPNNDRLEVNAVETIEAMHVDANGVLASGAQATVGQTKIEFIDESGRPTAEVILGGKVYLRAFSLSHNASPVFAEELMVQVRCRYSGDLENVYLLETGPNTGVFEGFRYVFFGSGIQGNGTLETLNSNQPDYLLEEMTATFGLSTDKAVVIDSKVTFLDALGRQTTTFVLEGGVWVRVVDPVRNTQPNAQDQSSILLRVPGDEETVYLMETSPNSGVFEGVIYSRRISPTPSNGSLEGQAGHTILAEYQNAHTPRPSTAQARFVGGEVMFLDAQGQPTSVYLEGTRAYLRVVDPRANLYFYSRQSVTVELRTDLSGDLENFVLQETGEDTGIFEGSIELRPMAAAQNNGILEVANNFGPRTAFDKIRARYESALGYGTATALAEMLSWRIWFLNAAGGVTQSYAEGSLVRVRLETHANLDPGQPDIINALVRSSSGDQESLQLQETGSSTGIFEGTLPLGSSWPSPSNGTLEAAAGDEISAERDGGLSGELAWAVIGDADIEFIDESGRAILEIMENTTARLRMFSPGANQSPFSVDSATVEVTSRYAADRELVTLTETGPGTAVFEGSFPLLSGIAFQGNGALETHNSGAPAHLGEEITARYGTVAATARTVPSRVVFLDEHGQETQTLLLGSPVRLRVLDGARNNPSSWDSVSINLGTPNDFETLSLNETGPDAGIFEGILLSRSGFGSSYNGYLEGAAGNTATATYQNANIPRPTVAQATLVGSQIRFVDAAGQPASFVLVGSSAFVRVADPGANTSPSTAQSVQAQISSELTGDQETIWLQETGANTGIFQGSILLRNPAGSIPGNSILEVGEIHGPPHRFDTLRAWYTDGAGGGSQATASTLNFRVWFIDAYGQVVDSYTQDTRVYVRMEDHVLNYTEQRDEASVTLYSSSGDQEMVMLLETGRRTGIFEGSIELRSFLPPSSDGFLVADLGDVIEARREQFNAAPPQAVIEAAGLEFIDETGRPTVTLLENGTARVRLHSPGDNFSSGIDQVTVVLSTRYAVDQEPLVLTETGGMTAVFEGSINLRFGFGEQGNGTLETRYNNGPVSIQGEEITAAYGPHTAVAHTLPVRLLFIDEFGRETTTFPLGGLVGIRVIDLAADNPQQIDTIPSFGIAVRHAGGVTSFGYLSLTETGFNTGVFEGWIPSTSDTSYNLYVLHGNVGDLLAASRWGTNTPIEVMAEARFTGGSITFVDESGQPASVYLVGKSAYVRVSAPAANYNLTSHDFIQVSVSSELTGDSEFVTLVETGVNTGIFQGSINLRMSTPQYANGFLEVGEYRDTPHEFDTLRASYTDPSGGYVETTASTLNFRAWFIDAYGQVVSAYTQGTRVYVRMEDHTFNDFGQLDQAEITLYSAFGDQEPLTLLETGKFTGIYEGSIELDSSGSYIYPDGRLQAVVGSEIEARRQTQFNAAPPKAVIEFAGLEFIDEDGRPTVTVLENGTARVRLYHPGGNATSGIDQTPVELSTRYAGDQETVLLSETGEMTGVFEGSIGLRFTASSQGNGTLETSNNGGPDYRGEEITAAFGPHTAVAHTLPGSLVFIDEFGRETTTFPLGGLVGVRLTEPAANNPQQIDSISFFSIGVRSGNSSSFGYLDLTETGYDTGVFEGRIPSTANGGYDPSKLRGSVGDLLEATRFGATTPIPVTAQARFTGGSVTFVDESGQPASVYLVGKSAYVRVSAPTANYNLTSHDFVQVTVSSELTGDSEFLTLVETGVNTGVFQGSISLRMSPPQYGNSVLEVGESQGPPHEFDTLRANYNDPSGGYTEARASTVNFRAWFIDSYSQVVSAYTQGTRVYVRVEDHAFNDPYIADQIGMTLYSSAGDQEPLTLLETGKYTGIYEGSMELDDYGSFPSADGLLQAPVGSEIEARRDSSFNAAPPKAVIEFAGIEFIDETGRPAVTVLENGTARVRLYNPNGNMSSGIDQAPVQLSTRYAGDQESLILTETGGMTGVFEGSINLLFSPSSQGNGTLETGNNGGPDWRAEEITASFGPHTALARTLAGRVVFIDEFGRETTTFPLGGMVGVRLIQPASNNPQQIDSIQSFSIGVRNGLSTSFGYLTLTETGYNTGVFEGRIASTSNSGAGSSVLYGRVGDILEVSHFGPYTPIPVTAQARFTGASMTFIDESGQPASVYLVGRRAYVRIVDPGANYNKTSFDFRNAYISSMLGGDFEFLSLVETGVNTGVFEGSIGLSYSTTASSGNYILEVSESQGPPHEFDSLRASYTDSADGLVEAQASTLNFRMWFLDAYGQVADTYTQGSRVYVRMEEHGLNNISVRDQIPVILFSSSGDQETIQLRETGNSTGIYEGSIELDNSGVLPSSDGRLQAAVGSEIEARHETYFNAAPPKARIEMAGLEFIDETGVPTVTVIENGKARVRLYSPQSNFNSTVDTVSIQLRTLYTGDQENAVLVETGPMTGVFEGSIDLRFAPASQSNGTLETGNSGPPEYRGEELTALYGPHTAVAHTLPGRVVFIDQFGRETSTFAVGALVGVRLIQPASNNPLIIDQIANFALAVQNGGSTSYKYLTLNETGYNSGVFEGRIASAAFSNDPSVIQASAGTLLKVSHFGPNSPTLITAQAQFTAGSMLFVDADGQPASFVLAGTRAYLRVVSSRSNWNNSTVDLLRVTLYSGFGGDREDVTLVETGANTATFEGSIGTRLAASPTQDNGILELGEHPIEAEFLSASFSDWDSNYFQADVPIQPYRVWFIDAYGQVVNSYPRGGTARVRLENHSIDNDPTRRDFATLQIVSSTGDLETLELLETGLSTSIFEGAIPLDELGLVAGSDGLLQAPVGSEIEAPAYAIAPRPSASATVVLASLEFIDEAGQPTVELLENGTARVRLYNAVQNVQPGVIDTVMVQVRSLNSGDQEDVVLSETGENTGVFEGSFPLSNDPGFPNDSRLETRNGGAPEFLGDVVTAIFVEFTAEARTLASRLEYLNLQNQVVSTYSLGSVVRLRLNDHNQPLSSFSINVNRVGGGDTESVQMTETASGSGIYLGSIPTTTAPSGFSDGVLSVSLAGQAIEAEHLNYGSPTYLRVRASFLGNAVPQASEDTAQTIENQPVIIPVLANDTDPEAGALSAVIYTQAGHGNVEVNPDGTITYLPADSYVGGDSFTYLAVDAAGGEAVGTVYITVLAANRPPVAVGDTASVNEDSSVTVTVLANDTDPDNDELNVTAVTQGTNGAVVINPDKTVTYTPAANFHGTDTFTYTIADEESLTATATVTVTVSPVNDAPVAVDDTASVDEDGAVTINVLGNDTDLENDTLTVTEVTSVTNGAAVINPDQTVTFTPTANFSGAASFAYSVSDGNGGADSGTVTITVSPTNDGPTANNDTASVDEDGSVTVPVLGNDTDPENDTLDVTAVTQGTNGTVVINPDKTVTYTPAANFSGTDSFTYTVSDGTATSTATVTITVTAANDAPVANADAATVAEDGSVNVSVLGNDTDADGDTLSVTAVTQGTNGTVVINPDKTVTHTPAANFSGTDSFTYTVSDGTATSTATVTITVTAANDAPVANADTATVAEDGSVSIAVLANDSDVENDTLSIASVTQGANGSVAINGGSVTYTPAANFVGSDSFTYTVSDGNGGTATASVTVTVVGANDAPVAANDSATVQEDGSVDVTVLGNDADPDGDVLTVASVTQGANGAVSINGNGTVKYTPAANFNGSDSFTYTISDGNGGTATATVTVAVAAVNDQPVANDDAASVPEDGSVDVAVLANDTDADGQALTVTAVTQGTSGSVAVNPDNTVTYTPSANFNGSDSFTYTVSDGNGGTATATVTITINAGNDSPVANADSATVAEDGTVSISVLDNDSDPENDTLSVASVTQGAHGSVTINANGTVTYVPAANYNGSDSFSYTVSDGNGGTATATVSVTVTAVNDAPVANADSATVAEDGSTPVTVLANDTDLDGDTLSVASVTQGTGGSVAINANGTVTYTPAANFNGSDSFSYTVSDGNGGTATATVTVSVSSVNDGPTANADSGSVNEDGNVNISVLGNDSDPDGDTLTVASVTQGSFGAVVINPDKTVKYTPSANYNGTDSFTYTVADGNGGTASAAVTVTVLPVNDAPVAANDSASVVAGSAVTITVLANDSDIDSASLTVTGVTQGVRGTVVINPDKTVTYTANLSVGSDSFTYTISDGNGGTATGTVTVTLQAPGRVASGLQARYDFNEGSGNTVQDTSGVGTPLNLTISNTSAVTWIPGGLSVNTANAISSSSLATKIISAAQSSNSVTVEAWITPKSLSLTGPARILMLAKNSSQRNIVFGQSGTRYETQTRTSSGTSSLQSSAGSLSLDLAHVVYTRNSAGQAVYYINGIQVSSQTTAGSLSGWATDHRLTLADNWRGDYFLVAVYGRALTATEVQQNYLAGQNAN